jgi:hypothetical protein
LRGYTATFVPFLFEDSKYFKEYQNNNRLQPNKALKRQRICAGGDVNEGGGCQGIDVHPIGDLEVSTG